MKPQDYTLWSELSGLYLANVSHADRYKTYAEKLSPAGLTTVVVSDFLKDNSPAIDVAHWRTFSVYEMGEDQQQRVVQTVSALEAIGASRTAAAVRDARSTSPFAAFEDLDPADPASFLKAMQNVQGLDLMNHLRKSVAETFPEMAGKAGFPVKSTKSTAPSAECETREQIEQFLEQFAAAHTTELQADIDRYGDPRTAPGFTVERRQQELERRSRQILRREAQLEDIEKLQQFMSRIVKLDNGSESTDRKTGSKLKSLRRDFLDVLKPNRKIAAEDLIQEMADFLPQAEAFVAAHPAVFQRDHIGDAALSSRAKAIGNFEAEVSDGETELSWESPQGLSARWTTFGLSLVYPKKQKRALRVLLDAVERLQRRWQTVSERWRHEIIECFRDNYLGQMDDWELEDYELDDAGEPTDASILSHVDGATITLTAEDDAGEDISCRTFFHVEWDEEHGFELEWDDEPDSEETGEDADFNPGSVQLVNSGRQLAPEDLDRFAARFGLELPLEYRQFLLQTNGGEPQPGHLVIRQQGFSQHADVEWFLSLSGAESAPWPENSIENALHNGDELFWPNSLLPIARIRMAGFAGEQAAMFLALRLSGKRPGEVVLFDPAALQAALPDIAADAVTSRAFEQMAQYAAPLAKSLGDLFRVKLQPRLVVELRDWLQWIREDKVEQFLSWLETGGKLSETWTNPEFPLPMQVLDFVTREASPQLVSRLLDRGAVKPEAIRRSWERYCRHDIDRFAALMPFLPKSQWAHVLTAPQVWDRTSLLEQLAAANVNFNAPVNEEGALPLHFAVQLGHQEAVRWLMAHGADPAKPDKYARDAFLWAESGPGSACLKILRGLESERQPTGPASPDAPGIAELTEAASKLSAGTQLSISIQMKSPPVTRVEKAYYPTECHYLLSIDVCGDKVTFKDMLTPRQSYLYAGAWPSYIFTPILQWPELTPLWDTLEVQEINWSKAMKSRTYQPTPRPDLQEAARSALEQAFNSQEAAARGVELRT